MHRGNSAPVVGFNLEDQRTIEAIRSRSDSVFEILEEMLEKAHLVLDIPKTVNQMELGWEYWVRGGSEIFEDYKKNLINLLDNPYADDDAKSRADEDLIDLL